MKVEVIQDFRDVSNFNLLYNVGEVIEVSTERAKTLLEKGLVKKVVEKEKAEK